MSEKKIPIKDVKDFPLWMTLFTMQGVSRSHGAHQASRAHMLYSVEAMAPTVFHWAEALLVVFKKQLTKCIHGELKRFGYGTIIMSFFLERVPVLRPQVAFNELRERDPCML